MGLGMAQIAVSGDGEAHRSLLRRRMNWAKEERCLGYARAQWSSQKMLQHSVKCGRDPAESYVASFLSSAYLTPERVLKVLGLGCLCCLEEVHLHSVCKTPRLNSMLLG